MKTNKSLSFCEFKQLLESVGFRFKNTPKAMLFRHPKEGLVVTRVYRDDEKVAAHDLASTRTFLDYRGLLSAEDFDLRLQQGTVGLNGGSATLVLTLDPEVQKLIDERVRSGKYATPEAVVAAALGTLAQKEKSGGLAPDKLDSFLAQGERSVEDKGTRNGAKALRRRRQAREKA